MKRIKLLFLLFVFSFVLNSGYTFAEVFELGEVVVTGNSEAISKVATIDTIDKQEIELNNSYNVAEALDNMPGLSISVGTRNEAFINVRGFNQRYVPVFFDGIPWYIPYDGYIDSSEISTGNISRISLSKGAASTLYGANTMGGVINIVSMKPTEKFQGSLSLDLTSDSRYRGSLNVGSVMGKFYFMGGLTGLDYDDFRMSDDFSPNPLPDAYYEDGGDRDNSDMQSTTESLKIGYMPAEGHEYALGYYHTDSERGLPPNVYPDQRQRFWRFPEWEKTTYYFIGDSMITDSLSAKIRLFRDEYYNVLDSYDDSTYSTQTRRSSFHSTYDDYTNGGSMVLRTDYFTNNVMSLSFHMKDDVHRSQGNTGDPWERYKTTTSSYGVEDAVILNDKMDLVVGVSYDLQEPEYADGNPLRDNDDSWNGILGITYSPDSNTQFHISAARKSRFPTQKELFSSYLDTAVPNPNLRKEQSYNYEAGIKTAVPYDINIDFAVFYSDVKDLITETLILVGEDFLDYNDNIGKARYQGFEFSLNTSHFDRNDIQLSYSYVDAKNKSPERSSDFLPEVPKHQLRITDRITLSDAIALYAKASYEKGQKEEIGADWIELDDYWLFDLKGIYKFSENIQAELSVKNILDENYSTSYGFPREGRIFILGLRTNF